jgi:predicted transcriptional regulator
MLLAMNTSIPSSEQIRARLHGLSHAEVRALSVRTGAPFTTLWKIRSGETADPRIETVRAIWPALVEHASAQQA